ncbi:hypothetical protein D3C83_156660 [compost metagenome]
MFALTAPVAKACASSAAWIVTGCAPASSAMREVYGLYVRILSPFMSAIEASGLLE